MDIATGAGHTAIRLAPFVQHVVASDITTEMLETTQQGALRAGLGNVETAVADIESLPYEDERFDLVTCRLAFHHFAKREKAFEEMARVTKPGGWLGFTDNFCVQDEAAQKYYNEYERLRDPSHFWIGSLDELTGSIESVGFQVNSIDRLSKELEFVDWADRQQVNKSDKSTLLQMMQNIPEELVQLFQPRWADDTMYFSLWEAVIVASKTEK